MFDDDDQESGLGDDGLGDDDDARWQGGRARPFGRRAGTSPRASMPDDDDDEDAGFRGMWWNDPSVFPGMGAPRFFSGYRELQPGERDQVDLDRNWEVNEQNAEEKRRISQANYETRAVNIRGESQEEEEREIREAAREIRMEKERKAREARFERREEKLAVDWEKRAAKRELREELNREADLYKEANLEAREMDREIRDRDSWEENRGDPEANRESSREMQEVKSHPGDNPGANRWFL